MSERIGERLQDGLDEPELDRLWRERLKRKAEARPQVRWWLVAASAALAGIMTFVMTRAPDMVTPGPLEIVQHSPERMSFSDASTVAIAPETHFAVRANDGARVDTVLDEGEVRLSVTPGGPRRWTIDCGVATVVVVGTELSIKRHGPVVTVTVHHGRVLVRSASLAGGERAVAGGETITIGEVAGAGERAGAGAGERVGAGAGERGGAGAGERAVARSDAAPEPAAGPGPGPAPASASAPAPAPAPAPARARATAPAPAVAPAVAPAPDVTQLLTDADAARRAGDHTRAAQYLDRFLELAPSHARAPLAAFTLGRIEADVLNHPARAAAAFERALSGLPASLVPDALARLALARQAAGDHVGARAAAERYLATAPDGTRAAAMRALIE